MDSPVLTAELNDHASMARLSAWIGKWDPTVAVARPPRAAALYEPDATLVGIAAGQLMTIRLNHRDRQVRPGDAIIVPAGLALEIEPEVDLLAVTCTGQAPDHFRERFIQVWGFDLFTAPEKATGGPASLAPVIPAADLRYRVHCWIAELPEPGPALPIPEDGLDLTLVLGIEGRIEAGTGGLGVNLHAGGILGVAPGLPLELSGTGRAEVVRLVAEPVFHARRALQGVLPGRFPSPEAGPWLHNPPDPQRAPGKPT